MFRRSGTVLVTMAILTLVVALPASAKTPPFDTEVAVDGRTATVTLHFRDWDGVGELTDDFLPESLEGFIAVYPASAIRDNGRPSISDPGIPVTVTRVTTAIYQGTVELEQGGEWAVVPFPGNTGVPTDIFTTTMFEVGLDQNLMRALVAAATVALVAIFAIAMSRRRQAGSVAVPVTPTGTATG